MLFNRLRDKLKADDDDDIDMTSNAQLIDATLERLEPSEKETRENKPWLGTLHRDLRVGTDVMAALDRTRLRGGRPVLRSILLSDPLTDVAALKARQAALKLLELENDNKNEESWRYLAEREADVLWLVGARNDEAVRALYDETLIEPWPLSMLNRQSPLALVAWNIYRVAMIPIMGLLAPVFYVIVPYLVVLRQPNPPSFFEFLRTLLGGLLRPSNPATSASSENQNPHQKWAALIVHWISMVISAVAYISGILGSVQHARNLVDRHAVLRERVRRAREFLSKAEALDGALWRPELAEAFYIAGHVCKTQNWSCGCRLKSEGHKSEKSGSGGKCKDLVRGALEHGGCLRDYASFRAEDAEAALRRVYYLDALMSIVRARRDLSMSWTEFVDAPEPEMRMQGLAHPCLPPGSVKRNDVVLGGHEHKGHMLLTGPNAGGKSTLMKAVLCAALLSQTLTVAPCSQSMAMTPFDMVGSHLNVADQTGYESMFEAEMHRMAGVLSESARPCKRLIAIDELFSSTNVVEGTAAAAACAKRLGEQRGTLSVISTHFTLVAKHVPHETFECCSMPVKRTKEGGRIEFPYALTKGSSTQYIALELMARHSESAFDAPLIADALRIKSALARSKPKQPRP